MLNDMNECAVKVMDYLKDNDIPYDENEVTVSYKAYYHWEWFSKLGINDEQHADKVIKQIKQNIKGDARG